VMAAFGAFNAVVAHAELVQSTPRAFYEIGLIVVVALAFVPSTLLAVHDVREADRARTGGRVARPGRLVRRLVPVLELGLERAVTLAESMDARGFARDRATRREVAVGWWSLGALLALAGAFVALVGQATTAALILGAVGIAGVVGATLFASREARRPRYRPRRMGAADWAVALAVLGAPALLAVASLAGESSLTWAASPLHWPPLHVVPAVALAPLLLPILVPAPADRS